MGAGPLSSVLSGLAGVGGNLLSSAIQGGFNTVSADAQRNFERQMANTTYQRGEADLKAAGLNPVLAAGGATDPLPTYSAPTISSPDLTGGYQSGIASSAAAQTQSQQWHSYDAVYNINYQTLDNLKKTGLLTDAQTANAKQQLLNLQQDNTLTQDQQNTAVQTVKNMLESMQGIKLANTAQEQKIAAGKLDAMVGDAISSGKVGKAATLIRGVEEVLLGPIFQMFK
jgi:hypothetical protein